MGSWWCAAALAPAYQNTSDMGDDYYFPSAALKLQLTDNVSFGLIYDQPFGAEATYSTADFAHPAGGGVFHNGTESTKAEVETQNLTMLFGFQPTENFNIYGGPVYQTAKGNVQLRGLAYGSTTALGAYNADMKKTSVGWVSRSSLSNSRNCLKSICNLSL